MDQQAFRHPQIERDSLMDFSQTPEAIAQGKKARAFGRDVLSLGTVDRDKQRSGSNWRDLWTASAEFGLLGLAIPEEFGGSGHDIQTTVHILKELGYGCTDAGLTLGMGAQIWSMQMPIQEFGTDAQKARYLPEMIAGKTICAHAVTEAASGSDAMSLTTTAKEVDGGFLLNGEKTYIGMAPTRRVHPRRQPAQDGHKKPPLWKPLLQRLLRPDRGAPRQDRLRKCDLQPLLGMGTPLHLRNPSRGYGTPVG